MFVSEVYDTSTVGSSGPPSPAPSPQPESDFTIPDTGSIKEGGFYLLRKDSERRSTLVRIMTDDQDLVSLLEVFCQLVLTQQRQIVLVLNVVFFTLFIHCFSVSKLTFAVEGV